MKIELNNNATFAILMIAVFGAIALIAIFGK
jgi:hypothetical protein